MTIRLPVMAHLCLSFTRCGDFLPFDQRYSLGRKTA